MTPNPCGNGWRIESASLGSGVIQSALRVVSFDCQNLLNGTGTATFVMHPGDVTNLRYVWPHATSLWVTYYDEFVWAGIVEGLSLQAATLNVGCNSLDGYLAHRNIRQTLKFAAESQNAIGAALVEYQRTNYGIPLYGVGLQSAHERDRVYLDTDRANLAEQITNLTQVEDGPEWRLTAQRANGRWTATMTFADHWGVDTDIVLATNVHAPDYGLEINSDNHATLVDAVGSGGDSGTNIVASAQAVPYPAGDSMYVEFDAAPSFDTITDMDSLAQHARGYLTQYREPFATPRMVLTGRETTQGLGIRLGDVITARMCFSGLAYEGPSRVIGETWRASPDAASSRELMLSPNGRPAQDLFDQPTCATCGDQFSGYGEGYGFGLGPFGIGQ